MRMKEQQQEKEKYKRRQAVIRMNKVETIDHQFKEAKEKVKGFFPTYSPVAFCHCCGLSHLLSEKKSKNWTQGMEKCFLVKRLRWNYRVRHTVNSEGSTSATEHSPVTFSSSSISAPQAIKKSLKKPFPCFPGMKAKAL